MKKIILIILVLITLIYFNIIPLNFGNIYSLNSIEEKYGVKNKFMPKTELLENYVLELSVLKTKVNSTEKKIVEFKINTAKGLIYLNQAQKKIDATGPLNPDCSKNGAVEQARELVLKARNSFLKAKKILKTIKQNNDFEESINSFIDSTYSFEKTINKLC